MNFKTWQEKLFALVQAEDLPAALQLLDTPPEMTSEEWVRAQFWRASILAALQQSEEALAALETIDGAGEWLPPPRLQDSDFDSIRQHPRFVALLDKWQQQLDKLSQGHTASLHIDLPSQLPPQRTLLTLHMNGANAQQTRPLFQPLTGQGWRVATAESGQLVAEGACVWDGEAQADAELDEWVRTLGGAPVWVGLSAGGWTAQRQVLLRQQPAAGLVLVISSTPSNLDWLPETLPSLPVAVLVGEKDVFTPRVLDLAGELERRGLPVRVWQHAGGHELPADWPQRGAGMLAWLTQQRLAG